MTSLFRTHITWIALSAIVSTGLTGCTGDATTPPGTPPGTSPGTSPGGGASDFISDNPIRNADENDGPSSGGAGELTPNSNGSSNYLQRAITEADILQIADGTLYALSDHAGLSIIDVSVKDTLTLLGHHKVKGAPFEMYLRDGIVYAMYSSWSTSVYDEASNTYKSVQTSHIEALDVTDPASITTLGTFDLPGSIFESRIVGDVLYTVTLENGSCWDCSDVPTTTITSLSVGNPGAIAVVDKLSYANDDLYGHQWRRSVSVTPERMYVAGVEWDGKNQGHSTIQVVDISDPTGQLIEGASVEVTGWIEDRWQMDEHEGVLRVISQQGIWKPPSLPTVQTFSIVSSQDLQPLGYTELTLPKPEALSAVRFDGARAYAVTTDQQHPLFTIDLSDPAHPQQLGEIQAPGSLSYIEPRGDRLITLGFDHFSPEGALQVALFDVSDLTQPTLIERVGFGGQQPSFGGDQDPIHKPLRVLDDLGLILVPYSGHQQGTYDDPCGTRESGIQLIDFTSDTLTKRGVAQARGQARRAFIHDDRLFAVSGEQVRTFSIDDRDAPEKVTELTLLTWADKTIVVGNHLVRMGVDWWTSDVRLEVVPAANPGQAEPLGALYLPSLPLYPEVDSCIPWGYGSTWLFTHDTYVYLVSPLANGGQTRVAVVNIADPTAPQLTGQIDLPFSRPMHESYFDTSYSSLMASGDTVLQSGSALIFRRREVDPYTYNPEQYDSSPKDPAELHQAWLEVVDLSNPSQPQHAATLELPEAAGHTALRIEGSTVLTSHWVPLANDSSKARFYIDRIDITDPTNPQALAPVNVPGSLVSLDTSTNRLLTVDYQWHSFPVTKRSECHGPEEHLFPSFKPGNPDDHFGEGTCSVLKRAFKLTELQGSTASLLKTTPIEEDASAWNMFVGDDRVFLRSMKGVSGTNGHLFGKSTTIMVVGGMNNGDVDVIYAQGEDLAQTDLAFAIGKRLVTTNWSSHSLGVLDATDMANVTFEQKAELRGYATSMTVEGDLALCSLGADGIEVVDLSQ